ncbi:anti-sigma factor family protein [Actinomadura sp. 9N215]|uniref:anti-sigma factor family protein n=1 Tax=Actinomadura sp. 9N215 TaxID=3375150 RepID=UPI00379A4344
MSSQVAHTDVGAYALGLLEEGDRRAFEAHLRGCGACQAELREMSGTAGVLSALGESAFGESAFGESALGEAEVVAEGEDEPSAPPAAVIDMMRRRRRADRRSRRAVLVVGTAAAAGALVAGIGVGTVLDDGTTPDPAPPVTGERFTRTNPETGASGTVGLVDKGWGTQVSLELYGIEGPLRCHLEAVSRDGERSVVAGWRVPDKGYGVPGQPKPLVMQGGTGLTRPEISRFEVRLDGGGTLLTIPL